MSMHPIYRDTTQRLHCSQIWGGIGNFDDDLEAGSISVSLFSAASGGVRGGDIYYFSICDNETVVRIAVADVVGHGTAASQISSWLYNALAANMDNIDGNAVLLGLNEIANQVGLKAMTTAAVLSFDVTDASLYLANAGHPPIWIQRGGERVWRPHAQPSRSSGEQLTNVPLGVFADASYIQNRVQLRAGDRFLIHTDGLTEASNTTGNEFGDAKLRAVLSESRDRSLHDVKHGVLSAVREHTGGTLGHDDVTLMLAEVH